MWSLQTGSDPILRRLTKFDSTPLLLTLRRSDSSWAWPHTIGGLYLSGPSSSPVNEKEFEWTVDCNVAFNQLKECLITAPVLSYPHFGPDKEFILETDASGVGLGARARKAWFIRLHLDVHEHNYGISELETLALVWAVKYFLPYILGHRTTVYTDHAACTSLLKTACPSGKLARGP